MKRFLVIGVALSALLQTGCSSIISDSEYRVRISSTPSQAWFQIENRRGETIYTGETPDRVTLRSNSSFFRAAKYTVTFRKDGYQEQRIALNATVDGWYFGNILLGHAGIVGAFVIDPATGAMWRLPPTTSATLRPDLTATDTHLTLIHYDHLSAEERTALIPVE
ncbi:MAG: hypothetical protein JJU10_02080 [Idiomarina sp.]|nr:hypothetical protein [Idiomarina sp.]